MIKTPLIGSLEGKPRVTLSVTMDNAQCVDRPVRISHTGRASPHCGHACASPGGSAG